MKYKYTVLRLTLVIFFLLPLCLRAQNNDLCPGALPRMVGTERKNIHRTETISPQCINQGSAYTWTNPNSGDTKEYEATNSVQYDVVYITNTEAICDSAILLQLYLYSRPAVVDKDTDFCDATNNGEFKLGNGETLSITRDTSGIIAILLDESPKTGNCQTPYNLTINYEKQPPLTYYDTFICQAPGTSFTWTNPCGHYPYYPIEFDGTTDEYGKQTITEKIFTENITRQIRSLSAAKGLDIDVIMAEANTNPYII